MRPTPLRVLVTVLGLDQHEAGALAVSRLLRGRREETDRTVVVLLSGAPSLVTGHTLLVAGGRASC